MCHSDLYLSFSFHAIGTDKNSIVGIKTSALPCVAPSTANVVTMQIPSELADILAHETNNGTCSENLLHPRNWHSHELDQTHCIAVVSLEIFHIERSHAVAYDRRASPSTEQRLHRSSGRELD